MHAACYHLNVFQSVTLVRDRQGNQSSTTETAGTDPNTDRELASEKGNNKFSG